MLFNCGVGEDSWESLGLQGDPTSPFWRRSALGFLWREWCWSWNSITLATSGEDLTHWKRLWCWEGLGAGGEGDDRGWDDILQIISNLWGDTLKFCFQRIWMIFAWINYCTGGFSNFTVTSRHLSIEKDFPFVLISLYSFLLLFPHPIPAHPLYFAWINFTLWIFSVL